MWPKFAHLIWIGLGPQKFGAINIETSLTRNILMHFTLPAYIQNSYVMLFNHYKHLRFCFFVLSCKWWNDWDRCHTWTSFKFGGYNGEV